MFIDDRKRKILQAIIDDYINTAEPIGSRTIARKHELGLSSATIRNEMADLEEMGFLAQPHTSAGRIPSDKGYRLYVDQLLQVKELQLDEIDTIKKAMEVKISEMSQLIRQAAAIMSKITKYTSLVMTPQMRKSILKAIQVVPIESGKALVIVVTNAGVVKNSLVNISDEVLPDMLIRISNIINEKLSGLTIEQINLPIIKEIEAAMGASNQILMPILSGVADCLNQIDNPEIYLDGTTNIFNYPEFRDIMKAREFLNILDEKELLYGLLTSETVNGNSNSDVKIQIGSENKIEGIKDCSLVTATYCLGDLIIGSIGIIGPTRMEYSKVIASMNYMRNKINQEIYKLIGSGPESG